MSQINTNAILDASGGTTTSINGYTPTASNMAGRNRIINGDMRIDQRNAGASVTPTNGQYTLDRWRCLQAVSSKYSAQQSSVAPSGFSNSFLATSLSAYSAGSSEYFVVEQIIEGFNTADLNWGTANAKTVTLSFWVYSSLTGTFGGAFRNSAANRSYPFTYTISSASTWEQKTITVAGDTTGTWVGATNGKGIEIKFGLGVGSTLSGTAGAWASANYLSATGATSVVGTSGATLYITGVQLEAGSVATPFEHRMYGQELALCQRYFEKSFDTNVAPGASGPGAQLAYCPGNTNRVYGTIVCRVTKRAAATYTIYSTSGATGRMRDASAGVDITASLTTSAGENGVGIASTAGINAVTNQIQFHYTASAEL